MENLGQTVWPRAITALMFLMLAATLTLSPLKYRWVYLQTNFFRPEAVDEAVALVDRAAKAGYNGILFCDSKLQSLDTFPDFYLKGISRFRAAAQRDHVDIIPGLLPVGYADGMLHLDASLVESLPCRQVRFSAENGYLVPDQAELYKNGDLKSVKGDWVRDLAFQDAPGKTSFVDTQVEHDGNPSVRIENPGVEKETNGNCRLVEDMALQPFHQYRFRFWAKTENFEQASEVRVIALDEKGANLSFQDVGIKPSEDWTEHDVVFNTLAHGALKLYVGVWGGTTGKMWISSISLKDAGFLNVDRRTLCPVTLRTGDGKPLQEGTDYGKVTDPGFGNTPWAGEFDFTHDIPRIPIPAGSRIKNGETVYGDYYAAMATESGKTSVCLADPKTSALEKAEVERVDGLFHSSNYMLGQDEMRVQGWCGACAKSGKTVSQLLADDIHRSVGFLKGKQSFLWSDMFDPFHNAVDGYYLVNGSLKNDWNGIPPGVVIVNWNSGHPAESLGFFHHLGFHQILAGYYDGEVDRIKPWLAEGKRIGGIDGVMYTTWTGDYKDLEAFARASWGD